MSVGGFALSGMLESFCSHPAPRYVLDITCEQIQILLSHLMNLD